MCVRACVCVRARARACVYLIYFHLTSPSLLFAGHLVNGQTVYVFVRENVENDAEARLK